MIRVLLLCCFVVVLDATEAAFSKNTGVAYAWFTLVQIVVYFAIGFFLRRAGTSVGRAALSVAVVAAVEATLGWWVSARIGPGAAPNVSFPYLVVGAVLTVAFMVAVGALGAAIGSIRFRSGTL